MRLIRRFSRLGEFSGLWLALGGAGALVARSRRADWGRAMLTVGAAHLSSSAVKYQVRRRRPAFEHLPHLISTPTGLSFPSSHATGSFAAAVAYGRLMPRPPLWIAACAMALSRIVLGVHYPADIAAGALLGGTIGVIGRPACP